MTNSACGDFLGSASARFLDEPYVLSSSLALHNPKNSSTILEFVSRKHAESNGKSKQKSLTKFLLLFAFAKSRISLLFRHCEILRSRIVARVASATRPHLQIHKKISRIAILIFALATLFTPLSADETFTPNKNHAITILSENDAYFEPFIKSDKYYTGGHYVSYLSPEFAQSWLNKIAGFSHLYDTHFTRFAVALKQELYTPNKPRNYDFTAPSNDILFGAGLYANLAFISRTRDFMEQFSLDIGVVGPLAYGKETQNLIHKATKNPIYRGWDAPNGALKNEVLINLHYGLIWRWVFIEDFFDVLPSVQISLGNALTAANMGVKFRVGYGIKNDFGLQKLRSRFAQNIISDGLKVYVFFGASGSAVARDIFVQGNTSALTRGAGVKSAVKLKHFFYDIEAGFMVGYKYFSLGYVWSDEKPRFREQNAHHQYGSIRLEIMF